MDFGRNFNVNYTIFLFGFCSSTRQHFYIIYSTFIDSDIWNSILESIIDFKNIIS